MTLLLLFLCSCFAAFIFGDRKISGGDALIACGLLAMGLYAVRAAAVFAVTVTPIAAGRCPYPFRPGNLPRDNRKTAWAVVFAALLAGILATVGGVATRGYNDKILPVGAYRFVRAEGMSGRMFNDPQYGHYFNYMGRGNVKLFIDGRLNAFGPARFRDMCVAGGVMRGWQDVLENHRIDFVLVPNWTALAQELAARKEEWPPVYSDDTTTVFTRKDRYPEVLRRHPGVVFCGNDKRKTEGVAPEGPK